MSERISETEGRGGPGRAGTLAVGCWQPPQTQRRALVGGWNRGSVYLDREHTEPLSGASKRDMAFPRNPASPNPDQGCKERYCQTTLAAARAVISATS